MMAQKAALFGDITTERRIKATRDPAHQKALGRTVSDFDEMVWERHRYTIVLNINFSKFRQHPELREELIATGDKHIAEASPHDLIWGIGFKADHPDACDPTRWRGRNLLGRILMDVRESLGANRSAQPPFPPHLHDPEPTPAPTDSTRVSPTADGIHETSPTPPWQPPNSPLGPLLPPSTPDAYPSSQFAQVSTVNTADHSHLPTRHPPIPEHGPCLTSGIITVDDASFTTKVLVHSGPTATTRRELVALLDTGSPQSFITATAVEQLKASQAATDACERHSSPRSWGGFGTSAPLSTSVSIRLSIQFMRLQSPTAALAVWACVVPAGTMQHPILLGRDSWMRFEQRSYTTLQQQPNPLPGEPAVSSP